MVIDCVPSGTVPVSAVCWSVARSWWNGVQSTQSYIRQVVAWAYHPSVKVSSQKSVEGRLRRLLAYVGVLCLPIKSDWQVAEVKSNQVFYMLVDT